MLGIPVRFNDHGPHFRLLFKRRGRSTQCWIVIDTPLNPRLIAHGWARRSAEDKQVNEIGRKIALAKAIKNTVLTKEERRVIWQAYFARSPKYAVYLERA